MIKRCNLMWCAGHKKGTSKGSCVVKLRSSNWIQNTVGVGKISSMQDQFASQRPCGVYKSTR